MRTKKKLIALMEIAIVLCSLFLVAIPAIAADQNQAMQNASATVVTTASEDDYVLGIYGNANEDDTIDMGDVVYTKLAIFGKKPKTELCDAKYDGRINVLDVIQTKLIILGKEKEITYVSILGEAGTIHKPIERIVDMVGYPSEVLRILNALDRVVAMSSGLKNTPSKVVFLPEITKLPTVGSWYIPDYEAILSHNPDAVVSYMPQAAYWAEKKALWEEKLPGISFIELSFVNPPTGNKWPERSEYNDLIRSTRKLGYIVDKEEEAEQFCDWYEGYFNLIKSRTDELSEDEKPVVYYEGGKPYTTWHVTRLLRIIDVAGGINLVAEKAGLATGQVDPEWVMEQNPDIIISSQSSKKIGYHVDDSSYLIEARDSVLNRPELASVNAVKNNRVYILTGSNWFNGPHTIIAIAYCAKWFHPDLFPDLDPKAIHQEYLDNFHEEVNLNVYEHGVFVYPPFED